jgi:hypothetical protein
VIYPFAASAPKTRRNEMTKTDQAELTIISRRVEFLLNKYRIETKLTADRLFLSSEYDDVSTTDNFITHLENNRENEFPYEKDRPIQTEHTARSNRAN